MRAADRGRVAANVRIAVGHPPPVSDAARSPGAAPEAGEGVVSTAIAVLVMALLGAAMWVAFNGVFQTAESRIADSVENIGGP